jgi:hypothetical protein
VVNQPVLFALADICHTACNGGVASLNQSTSVSVPARSRTAKYALRAGPPATREDS